MCNLYNTKISRERFPFCCIMHGQTTEIDVQKPFRATARYSRIHLGFRPRSATLNGQLSLVPVFDTNSLRYIVPRLFSYYARDSRVCLLASLVRAFVPRARACKKSYLRLYALPLPISIFFERITSSRKPCTGGSDIYMSALGTCYDKVWHIYQSPRWRTRLLSSSQV